MSNKFNKHHPVIYLLLILLSYYMVQHGRRLFSLETAQQQLIKYNTETQLKIESLQEKTDKNEELRALVADAHLYIASLENQVISMKEDLKQCERKKLEE